ncbi:MAG TPA: rhodanese-like domain-containing protein [Chitinophagales bacterium]|nr:rhodanese-like domain-containing protein [Chitinophagales bacterium]
MSFFRNLFGLAPEADFADLVNNKGATIVDVRTRAEYSGGHIKGSVNIPLDQIHQHVGKLKNKQPIVTCCCSGARSASATSILKSNGLEAYNGGGWASLNSKVR